MEADLGADLEADFEADFEADLGADLAVEKKVKSKRFPILPGWGKKQPSLFTQKHLLEVSCASRRR